MSYLRDRAILLKKEPFREQDRRYALYTRAHGLLITTVRGASSRASKNVGHLEPFSEAEVLIARGRTSWYLAVARSLTPASYPPLAFFATCGGFIDLVLRLIRPGMVEERLFSLLREVLSLQNVPHQLWSRDRALLVHAAATLHLLDLLGYAPVIRLSRDQTSPVPSLELVAQVRRMSLSETLSFPMSSETCRAACAFIEEQLRATPLEREPHGPRSITAFLS